MNYGKTSQTWPAVKKEGLDVVVCGSFRRTPRALRRELLELEGAGCAVLSPQDLDFVAEVDGFVFGQHDVGRTTADIERGHLRSMEKADFVWLHCPDGYVGTSATMELGFAKALGLRVFSAEPPKELVLSDMVHGCGSPPAAAAAVKRELRDAPSDALVALQSYYGRAAERRGWSDETVLESLDLLKGEIGELEAAIDGEGNGAAALELADVQLYVVHLANILAIDLGEAVRDKERINHERFDPLVSDSEMAA